VAERVHKLTAYCWWLVVPRDLQYGDLGTVVYSRCWLPTASTTTVLATPSGYFCNYRPPVLSSSPSFRYANQPVSQCPVYRLTLWFYVL